MKFGKVGLLFLVLTLVLGSMGVGYAMWDKTLDIGGTVETGEVDAIFTKAMSNDPPGDTSLDPKEAGEWTLDGTLTWTGARWDKDVGSLEVTGAGIQTLTVTLDNGYPGYYPSVGFTIDNQGTIPVKIESIQINGEDYTCPVNLDFDNDGDVDVEVAVTHIGVGQQIDPGGEQLGDLDLYIFDKGAMEASQGIVDGSFVVTIVTAQWNEVAASTPSVPSGGSIQDAIDAASAGDTIYIAAGTYTENVVVNKAVTLRGAGPDVCTVTAASSTTHVFNVTADGVTISGFTITGCTDAAYGINLEGVDGCCIFGNKLLDNPIAIALRPGSDDNVIESNYISTTGDFGISLISSDNNLIKGNRVELDSVGQAIWVDTCSNCEIIANACSVTSGSAIRLVGNMGDGYFSGNIVRGNVCKDSTIGISLNNGADNLIESNICTNIGNAIRIDASYGKTSSGNIIRGNRLVNGWSAAIAAVNWCWPPEFEREYGFYENILITENEIYNNRAGIYLTGGDTTNWPVDATAFAVNNNNIAGNELYGAKNLGTGTLDAENNWWGDPSGPAPTGTGDEVIGDVDYDPWATAPFE